ncbi:Zinc finger protein [Quillaja saponaria]|uniref:Zinc finger protein n=1 Tax=Quillaja saponaria TaxID=32244 RepID=A0AAD7KSC3_QUISA|nr:Zinc finger protein [Quillaja saponaria]
MASVHDSPNKSSSSSSLSSSCGRRRDNVPYSGGTSGGGRVGGGGGDVREGGGGNRPPKRRAELINPPLGPPRCRVCSKEFSTWKAVFGHMRLHSDRTWRGSFPPPCSSPPNSPRREGVVQEQTQADQGAARGLEIDLNREPIMEETEASAGTRSRAQRDDEDEDDHDQILHVGFDLNMPPPSEDI